PIFSLIQAKGMMKMTQTSRHFLFLQGPVGPFFKQLGRHLQRQSAPLGINVSRINFSGGDWVDWPNLFSPNVSNFTGTLEQWPEWVRQYCTDRQVTDIVLFGDCRPYHQKAIKVAKSLGLHLHMFEEGYLRPQWITLEHDGVNGHSSIKSRFMEHSPDTLEQIDIESEQIGAVTTPMVLYVIKHYLGIMAFNCFFKHRFKHFTTHRKVAIGPELAAWLKLAPHRGRLLQRGEALMSAFLDKKPRFFLLPLQLEYDAQVLFHSQYDDFEQFLNDIIQNFAQHAPKDLQLVIKTHPLDSHLKSWRNISKALLHRHELSERSLVLEGGHLPTLLDEAEGLVTLNSTTGIQSIHHQCPTKVIGEAVYDVEGLTDQQPLASFWHQPQKPVPKRYREYFRFLIATCQINGNYYNRRGRKLALDQKIVQFMMNPERSIASKR
ncbi:MAG: capsular biosynthesis protein, partial [Pseudomonadota bacterium]|nr:capsular biosynthesis protein [Pseudomonadota bacterium]